ncbi:MAG TPA: cupin domain-containing protein [Thermoanaerobaculia bacterium]|jgi:quercetin dioxygenase-like cupin family protein|nr:cupin domain-containing protein [Thermoanaerobaculia bacterium]
MKLTKSLLLAAAATALLLLSPQRAPAQDPAVVNAKTIRVKLENNRVRVLEAALPPGAKEQMHSHPAYVIYVIAGGKVRNHAADGTVSEVELATGETIYRDPVTHWAENIGTTTIRIVLVELKGPA